MAVTYKQIPTMEQFKKDSSVFLAVRASDKVLLEIDTLLADYPILHAAVAAKKKAPAQEVQHLAQLWFTCDYWLKIVDGGGRYLESTNMNAGRRPVIYELYRCIVATLCTRLNLTINKLPDWLEKTFGRGMGKHGVNTDKIGNAVQLTPEQLKWFRLHFLAGVAYQLKWWENSTDIVRADSQNSRMAKESDKAAWQEGMSGYVLGMGRDFYLAPHFLYQPQQGNQQGLESFYHSSYLAGQTILCAGTIKIVNGEVQLITNDSGHYRPTSAHLAQAVGILRFLGARTDTLKVRAWGKQVCSGDAFLMTHSFDIGANFQGEFALEDERMKAQRTLGDQDRRQRAHLNTIIYLEAHFRIRHRANLGFGCNECTPYKNKDGKAWVAALHNVQHKKQLAVP